MTDLVYQAEQVQQLLRCAICLDRFHHPKLLPCQHTFCETPCLEGLIDHYTRRVRCPECRLEHRVPMNGTAGFPNNLTIIGFLDLPHQAAATGNPSGTPGNQSSQGVTEISHPEARPRDNAPLAQLEYHTPTGQAMCSDCGRIAVLTLCTHCNEQICEVCRHSHVSSLKLEISRQLQRIRRALPNMSESLSSVEHRREQLRRMCDSVKCVILDTIERFIRDLKLRQDQLYSEIDEFLFAEIRSLQEYQENLELELTSIASFCDNTEPLLVQRPDIESSHIDLQDIKRQGQEHITTLQNQVSLELPTARQLTFQDDSSHLSPAISSFGELMVMIQNNSSSSYIRNSVLGYPDSSNRTFLRDYGTSRESPRTVPSTPRSHSSATEPSSSYRRTESSHSIRGSGSNTPSTPTNTRNTRTEALASTPSSASSGVRFANSTSSVVASPPPHPRYSAATSSPGLLTSSRREHGGAPSSYLDSDRPDNADDPARHTAGPGASSVASSSSENSLFSTRRDEPTSGASSGARNEYSTPAKSKEKRSSPTRSRRQQQEMVPYSEVSRPSTSSAGSGVPSAAGASNDNAHVYRSVSPTLYERRSLPNSPNSMRRDPELPPDNEIFPSALTWHPRSENLPRFGGHSRQYGHYYTHNMTLPSSANWMDSYGLQDRYPSSRLPASNNSVAPSPRRRPEALTYLHPGETDESSTSTENDLANERRHPLALTRTEGEIYSSSDEEEYGDESTAPGFRHCKSASTIVSQARNNYQAKHRSWTRFGEPGSGESQFMAPRGVSASPEDEIYICDSSNHRIQVFDNTGIFAQSFGCYGQGDAEFDCISGVAVNNFGHIAATDRYNNRIQLFDRHGRFQTAFGNIGSNDGEMKTPWGIAWDNMGFIYVCDKENNRIQVFQANGNFVRKFGRPGNGQPGTFNSPHYVAVSPENLIYVTDSNNHRVQVFSIYGDYLFGFGGEGVGRGQLCNPRGISIDDQGFVIIADCGNHRIQVFRGDGRFYSTFGSWGEQSNQFKSPEGVTVMTNGAVAVSDRENNRVQLF